MTCPALSMIEVVKRYHAGVPGCSATVDVLRSVDVQVHAGEILALVAPPGAGKSTLLLCAAGLLRPDAGTVRWFGSSIRPVDRSRTVAFVAEPQRPYARRTVREALATYAPRPGLLLLDDALPPTECARHASLRETLCALAEQGTAIVIASRSDTPLTDVATRHATLVAGVVQSDPSADQRRNRSAARTSGSSWAARASASMRSTNGRNFRSPQ